MKKQQNPRKKYEKATNVAEKKNEKATNSAEKKMKKHILVSC